MLEGVEKLVELSRLDGRLASLESEHAGIPERRNRIAEARSASEARDAAAEEAVLAAEAGQRKAEAELQDQEELLKRLEGQQHQVKSNEAYTALLHEMEQARQGISEAETAILEGMEAAETARSGRDATTSESAAERKRLGQEEEALAQREAELQRETSELGEERARVCSALDPAVLSQYEKVLSRRVPAVAVISSETCSGCRVGIPPQLFIELLKGEQIISCNSCRRILIHEQQIGAA